MTDVPDLKLTHPVRAVMRALAACHNCRMPVAHLSREARLSPSAVRVALTALGKARLVQHALAPGADRQPPRMVYWLTGSGVAVATGQTPTPTAAGTPARG